MKTFLFALIAASTLLASTVHADTVVIHYQGDLYTVGALNATGHAAFVGAKEDIFAVAGKACTFVGSASAIGPKGCNYELTVNVDGELVNPVSNGNSGCTPASKMLAKCVSQ